VGTVNAVQSQPDLGQFKFYANTKWIIGGYSEASIQSFFDVGQEDSSRGEAFVLEGDEPSVLRGTNKAPNTVEAVHDILRNPVPVSVALEHS